MEEDRDQFSDPGAPAAEASSFSVAVVQTDPVFGRVKQNLTRAAELIGETAAHLVVLPELFNSGYLFESRDELASLAEPVPQGPTVNFLLELARAKGCYLTAGLAERAPDPEGRTRYYNSAVLVGPQGLVGHYRKLHLFDREKLFFSPGDLPLRVHDLGGLRVGVLICFDWIFPEAARCLALQGADLLAHPSNLVLPHCPQAMITRALENRVFAATANRVGTEARAGLSLTYIGQSQLVSPTGEILSRAGKEGEVVLSARIRPAQARNKTLGTLNDLLGDRRPEFYESLG